MSSDRPTLTRVIVLAALLFAVWLVAGPSSASAIGGVERVAGTSQGGTDRTQFAVAKCDPDQDVVGGGAWISDGGRNRARLVALTPLHVASGADQWTAVAQAPAGGNAFSWKVAAYALCVREGSLWDYKIETASYGSTGQFKTIHASCLGGRVAWGSGAQVFSSDGYGSGRIGLQLNRTSGPLDISRAAARTDGSFSGNWTLFSTAICARPNMAVGFLGQSDPGAEAEVSCGDRTVHGPGGGGGLTDGGPVWLRKIYPTTDLDRVQVELTGALHPSIGGMAATSTCAY